MPTPRRASETSRWRSFPALTASRERSSEEAATLIRTIDKDPSDFLNWVHWNNASLFTHGPSIRRGSSSLIQADRAMMGRFLNTAHRSTYWTQHLTALAASTANAVPLEGRIFPSYPHYLRRSAPVGRGSIVEKLAELAGTNRATTRDEFLHPLFMLSQDDSQLGDSTLFDISLNLGLTGRNTCPWLVWPKRDARPRRSSRTTKPLRRSTKTTSWRSSNWMLRGGKHNGVRHLTHQLTVMLRPTNTSSPLSNLKMTNPVQVLVK